MGLARSVEGDSGSRRLRAWTVWGSACSADLGFACSTPAGSPQSLSRTPSLLLAPFLRRTLTAQLILCELTQNRFCSESLRAEAPVSRALPLSCRADGAGPPGCHGPTYQDTDSPPETTEQLGTCPRPASPVPRRTAGSPRWAPTAVLGTLKRVCSGAQERVPSGRSFRAWCEPEGSLCFASVSLGPGQQSRLPSTGGRRAGRGLRDALI